jgi:hypothetical protein
MTGERRFYPSQNCPGGDFLWGRSQKEHVAFKDLRDHIKMMTPLDTPEDMALYNARGLVEQYGLPEEAAEPALACAREACAQVLTTTEVEITNGLL